MQRESMMPRPRRNLKNRDMLTLDMINANESLSGLSDEQKQTIATMSENDENVVIGKKIGEIHRQYDVDIEESTGIKRDGDEKSYDYAKRAGSLLRGENEELKAKLGSLTERNAKLEKSIENGGNDAYKAEKEALMAELESTKKQYSELKEKSDNAEAEYGRKLDDYKMNSEINDALSQMKFKSGLNEAVIDALKERGVSKLKTKNPIFEDRGGKEVLVYHNEDGSPMNNVENKLEPFTTKELLTKYFDEMDLLDKRASTGAGGREEKPQHTFINASTRVEAEEMITKELVSKGLVRGSSEYQNEFTRLWNEGDVSKLPLR